MVEVSEGFSCNIVASLTEKTALLLIIPVFRVDLRYPGMSKRFSYYLGTYYCKVLLVVDNVKE